MSPKQKIIIVIAIVSLPLAAIGFYAGSKFSKSTADSGPKEYKTVYWNKLRELDLKTKVATPELKALNGQRVKVPGFVVPLEDDDTQLSEFLLVPSPTACIHVPPPPPNQMIFVRMNKGVAPKREWGPIWLEGVIRIQDQNSNFGVVSYQMTGESTQKFEY